jgi:hypothetical protein
LARPFTLPLKEQRMITFGSGQTNGLPLLVTAITEAGRQTLHTAPAGSATPHRVAISAALVPGASDTKLSVVVANSGGTTLRTIDVQVKSTNLKRVIDDDIELNGTCVVGVYAAAASVVAVVAEVDDQSNVAGTAVQAICSGLVAAVQNTAMYAVGAQGGAGDATETEANIQIPRAGILRNLRAVPSAAVGGTASVSVTVRKNGAATALTVTFVNADGTTAKTDTDSVAVAAGDLICFEVKETANQAPGANFQASVEYIAS